MFKTEKNGYARQEVDAYIKKLVTDHDKEVMEYKMKNLELEKKLLEEKPGKNDEFAITLASALEKAKQIEMSWRNIYKLKIQQLDLLYNRFQSLFTEALEKYPQLENIGNIKNVIDEFKSAVKLAMQEDFNTEITAPVQTDNDTIRRLLSKMATYGKDQDEVRTVKVKRRRNLRDGKGDIFYEEKSNIKPIAEVDMEGNDNYDSPVEKFLHEDSSDATYTNFLSKNPKSNGLEPNESGFDLKEAVNPTEDLEEIMKAFNFYPGKK